ncbi:unnamed protein product [Cuscuta campestris]|uniref:Retrotransposon gag domain-containing protein n=1 Tax=Cuscuta campestris TaxID=132261 RepID=A0A484LL75_9ASTE|nr:unnamed protein product [Cuscuta campestris]
MGIIRKVTCAPSPPTLPPRCDGTKPVQWLAMVCEYFQFYDVPLVDRLNRVASMLEGSVLAWFNWRMRGGLIDGWTDFVEKFKIRFAPLHDLDYIYFEKTPKNVIDKFAHKVEDTTILPTPTMEDALEATKLCTGPRGEAEVSSVFEAMNEDNGKPNTVEVIDDDRKHAGVAKNYKLDPTFQDIDTSLDEEFLKVDNSISLDTFKLFDLDDIEKFEYLAPLRIVRYLFGFASTILCSASIVEICNDGPPGGDLLWLNHFPFVQKHEWEPPP